MSQQPWASGPSEILQHGLSLLNKDSDSNRRLAMLSIDNAVELTIKTFLSLPRRITGINLSRKEFQEISESFPLLLDALEKHSSDRLNGINLGEIEWFHRLRNQLYHQGNGLTVDKDKVEIYAELAKILFQNLFGFEVQIRPEQSSDLLGEFLTTWVKLEKILMDAAIEEKLKVSGSYKESAKMLSPSYAIKELVNTGKIQNSTAIEIGKLSQIRNQVIHGKEDFRKVITSDVINQISDIIKEIQNIS